VRSNLSLVLDVDLEVVGQDRVVGAQEVDLERDLVLIDLVQTMSRIKDNKMVRLTPRQKKGVKTSLKTLKRTQIQWIKYWRTKLRRRSSSQKVPRSRSRKLKWFRSRLKPLLRKLRRLRKLTSLRSKNQFLSPKTLKSLR